MIDIPSSFTLFCEKDKKRGARSLSSILLHPENKQEQKAATSDGKIKMKTYTCNAKFLGCEGNATSNLMADAKIQATTKLVKAMFSS